MECEVQPSVPNRIKGQGSARGMCVICGQIIGRSIRNTCSPRDQLTARQARVDRGRSLDHSTKNRRKRNLSLLVGREEEKVQEQIISAAFNRIAERKGERF